MMAAAELININAPVWYIKDDVAALLSGFWPVALLAVGGMLDELVAGGVVVLFGGGAVAACPPTMAKRALKFNDYLPDASLAVMRMA